MSHSETLDRVMRRLASHTLGDDAVNRIVNTVERSPYPVVDLEICTHGIVYHFDVPRSARDLDIAQLTGLLSGDLKWIKLFPEGIPLDDRTRVSLAEIL